MSEEEEEEKALENLEISQRRCGGSEKMFLEKWKTREKVRWREAMKG